MHALTHVLGRLATARLRPKARTVRKVLVGLMLALTHVLVVAVAVVVVGVVSVPYFPCLCRSLCTAMFVVVVVAVVMDVS